MAGPLPMSPAIGGEASLESGGRGMVVSVNAEREMGNARVLNHRDTEAQRIAAKRSRGTEII